MCARARVCVPRTQRAGWPASGGQNDERKQDKRSRSLFFFLSIEPEKKEREAIYMHVCTIRDEKVDGSFVCLFFGRLMNGTARQRSLLVGS